LETRILCQPPPQRLLVDTDTLGGVRNGAFGQEREHRGFPSGLRLSPMAGIPDP
jgi:hypothetical protein